MAGELLIDTPLDGVRRLTISNPAKRNALDHAILDGIAEAVRAGGGRGNRARVLTPPRRVL
jgi:enoyl-CoA hydratase/carnithine racemase